MADDFAANRMRFLVENKKQPPGTVEPPPGGLPSVPPPSLEGLEVRVPALAIEEEALIERFEEYRREFAQVEELPEGSLLQMGHEVLVDVMGYSLGKLLPFSVQTDAWVEMAHEEELPGFFEGLVGRKVGESVELELVLPEDYVEQEFAGQDAIFMVDIKAARRVTLPSEESPAFLEALGKGRSLEEVMEAISDELADELEEQLWEKAQELVLEELGRRAQVSIPPALIDEHIHQRWREEEEEVLVDRDFSDEELQEAFEAWRVDPDMREEAARGLRNSMILDSLALALALTPSREMMDILLEELAQSRGGTPQDIERELAVNPAAAVEVQGLAKRMMALEHVMAQATIHFEGDEEEAAG
jgi:trigger factor